EIRNSNKVYYKCFSIENFKDLNFIKLYGNKWECDIENSFYKVQIFQINSEVILLAGFIENQFVEIKLESSKKSFIYGNEFTLCNDLLYPNNPANRYYAVGTRYNGGIFNITKTYRQKYKMPAIIKESGLIRIRFIVNCRGETGRFEMIEMDENYSKKSFNPIISSQILQICKELNDWIPGKNDTNNVDSYKFLTFKIQDSEIVEIFP
ncbi:MAG: hypothetical protein WAU01_11330, partial [Saprospiraceae bacterium]